MDSDSATTKRQKTDLHNFLTTQYGLYLPPWFIEGVTVADLRTVKRIFIDAAKRATHGDEDIPTRRAGTVLSCPICQGTSFVYVGASDWLLCADPECGGEIRIATVPKGE